MVLATIAVVVIKVTLGFSVINWLSLVVCGLMELTVCFVGRVVLSSELLAVSCKNSESSATTRIVVLCDIKHESEKEQEKFLKCSTSTLCIC